MKHRTRYFLPFLLLAMGTGHARAQDTLGVAQMNNRDQATSAIDAIRGRVAGMTVQRSSVGAMDAVRLRGTTSLSGGNDPLIIVDGVMGDLSLLQNIYPTDIESFTIKRDASETSQYGSRGAAGVIEVTTLHGAAGRLRVTYNGSMDVAHVYRTLPMLDAHQYRAAGQQLGVSILDKGSNTNFQREITRAALSNQHHLAFYGGTDEGNYRVSLGYQNQQQVVRDRSDRTFMSNMNMSQQLLNGRIRVDIGMFGSVLRQHGIYDEQKLFYSAAAWNPTFPSTKNALGEWDGYPSASQINNPLALLDMRQDTEGSHLSAHAKATVNIINGLTLTLFGAYTYDSQESATYLPTSVWNKGEARRAHSKAENLLGQATLDFKRTFSRVHDLSLSAMAEVQEDILSGFNTTVTNFSTDAPGYDNLAAGALRPWGGTGSFREEPTMASFMGRAAYTYDGRYTLAATARGDGSSKFGRNHKWGFFPSLSGTWQLAHERFMKGVWWVDDLRLTAGFGLSGNQSGIDSYTSLALFSPAGYVAAGSGSLVSFAQLRNQNPDLKWEVSRTWNAGLAAELLKHRMALSVNYYRTLVEDMLYPYPVSVPPFTYPTLVANLGSMRNTGVELSVGGTPLQRKDMELNLNANLSLPRNRLLSLSGYLNGEYLTAPSSSGMASVYGAGAHGANDVTYTMVGQPLGVFYLPHCSGLKETTLGRGYDVETDASGAVTRHLAGQAMPKVLLGSNIGFRWRDLDLTVQVNGAFGHKIFNGTSLTYMNLGAFPLYNVLEDAIEARIHDQQVSDYWLENGNYVNIDYITLGYQVPLRSTKWVESLRLSATMNNVCTFTAYSGLSPMINSSNAGSTLGLDDKNTYPVHRTYTFGVSMNF